MKAPKNRKPDAEAPKDDDHTLMLKRYQLCTDFWRDMYAKAQEAIKFCNVKGEQWDKFQLSKRKNRPCYEFNQTRQICRHITNAQRQQRPNIKIVGVEDSDKKGAELRQGLIKNIEMVSNADNAYDTGFKYAVEGGYGVIGLKTDYTDDTAWDQDILINEITDPFSIWFDHNAKLYDRSDSMFAFEESSLTHEAYRAEYPDTTVSSWDSNSFSLTKTGWFTQDQIRIVKYWYREPYYKTLVPLQDGKVIEAEKLTQEQIPMIKRDAQGQPMSRKALCYRVYSRIANGTEFITEKEEWPDKEIPLVPVYGDLFYVDGRQEFSGAVEHMMDAQRLVNYSLTTAHETIAKQPKSPYLLTTTMLEGKGIKDMWDKSNAVDAPYLAYTPDPAAPNAKPTRENPPEFPASLVNMGTLSVDMIKAVSGVYDASLGQRSNETSGKAIKARDSQADTANFNYIDNLGRSLTSLGKKLVRIMPVIYDTQRVMRVIGPDGGESNVTLNNKRISPTTLQPEVENDLSAGRFDVTVKMGAGYATLRQEFNDLMMGVAQSNPELFAASADLFYESMDGPYTDKLAERAKAMLPPQIQGLLQKDKDMPPEVAQAFAQVDQAMQQVQAQQQELDAASMKVKQEAMKVSSDKSQVSEQLVKLEAARKVLDADFKQKQTQLELERLQFRDSLQQGVTDQTQQGLDQTAAFLGELLARQSELIAQHGEMLHEINEKLTPPEIAPAMGEMETQDGIHNGTS